MIEEKILTIDFGTTEIRVAVGTVDRKGNKRILTTVSVPSQGIKSGSFTNPMAVKDSLTKAMNKLKLKAPTTVPAEAHVLISGSHTLSYQVSSKIVYGTLQSIQFKEVNDLKNKAEKELMDKKGKALKDHYETIHIIPQEFIIENLSGIQYPIGHSGNELEMKALIILVTKSTKKTIENILKNCGLKLKNVILQSLAASYGIKNRKDIYLNNSIFLYMGASSTEWFYFKEDKPIFQKTSPFGGEDIVDYTLNFIKINRNEIEKIMKENGNAYAFKVPKDELITINFNGKFKKLPKIALSAIIQTKLQKLIKDIKTEISRKDPGIVCNLNKIYISGGLSQLKGIDTLITKKFKTPVEICEPFSPELDKSFIPAIGGITYVANKLSGENKLFEVKEDIVPSRAGSGTLSWFSWFKNFIDQLI